MLLVKLLPNLVPKSARFCIKSLSILHMPRQFNPIQTNNSKVLCRFLESNVKQLTFVKLFSDDVQPVNGKGKKKRRRVVSSDEEDVVTAKKSSPQKSVKISPKKSAERSPSQTPIKDTKVATPVKDVKVVTPVKDAKVEKDDGEFVTSPIKFENEENDSPKTKKQTKASAKSKAKTPKANAAKKAKIEKKTTPKSASTSPKETVTVRTETNVTEEKAKADSDADDKKENIKKEKESPLAKKPAAIHSFFTSAKTTKEQSTKGGVSDTDYNPEKQKYHPIDDAFWKHGEKVPYLALARTFEKIEDISSRLKMIEVLSNFYRSVIVLSPNDLVACVFLCLNQLAPSYEGLELGVAEHSLMKVIAEATGRSLAQIKTDVANTGDMGIVAQQSKRNQTMLFVPAALMVTDVFEKLREIAKMTGQASMGKKGDKIQTIFRRCRHSEARFFVRSLLGKLRIGLAEQSVLQALALACTLTPPNQKEYPPPILTAFKNEAKLKEKLDEVALEIKTTYCQCPNFGRIIEVLLNDGVDALSEKCQMLPGTPLKPMLAHPTKGVQEVLQRFDGIKFTCEYKYDGERAQIHIDADGTVSIFSRNQENNTSKYPDIIGRIDNVKNEAVRSCILDCEAVAWDCEKQQILPFQVLSTRKRKDANESDIKVKVIVFMFDLLYLNGEPLVTRSFIERRNLLREHFREVDGEWKFATALDTSDIDELQNFLEVSVKENCEGLMVKTLEKDATYEIAKRSRNWLKLKKDYLSGVGDSLDLVVIGGYKGKGKRTGTYGGFLLACYDSENEEYQSICKIGTGFTEEDLQKHSEFLKTNIIPNPKSYYKYDSSHQPDDWFEPVQVWEVLCADLSLSPVHKAAMGIVDPVKGISLRFPRFIRIRDDKAVEDATTACQVADMYSNQDQIKNQDKSGRDVEEDFY
ncbi:DNA ligase 1 isoform X1 [Bradysia coprophila]|uniref:DNA ligase 1 isoform X1 n=1 Tax=Bradysia coprophila TaxID=38358 RepID=UPI00187DC7A5|nr:DNA ligase 1 isoform X1 [Bradysia coprophila]